ncbi:MAG: hypothetical protein A3A98_04095 [Candidatus Staskawiczbacteria bacterium RIFCSPLOWO2_01_FULL_40_39]|uniref:Uncharacterized protein n=1 Tax=Candidatus Staskawiczbacteria bacterium RIFCSPHIGHO2_01_FULL_39_25 TaxID=1802202 RepID=A0A1G2HNM2_9BACT|nr:MAG: hypothetical protein A2730_03310 [Candidatus Staskawiczbacteria bacterium RIFCSPHIGHO2_01_FULL_39_25]OGZ73949.1 MAG: hypothetical protein A3A98_04095 [Candidatus Staskawiczbacteria bacterium RIFCSPLOWO2_01_FULL_40_39]
MKIKNLLLVTLSLLIGSLVSGGVAFAVPGFFAQGGSSFLENAFLGTNDNFPLIIETNNIERARFDTNGNLGIGTSSPSSLLSLGSASTTTGSLSLANSSSASLLTLISGNNSSPWTLTFPISDGNSGEVLKTDGSGNTSWGSVADSELSLSDITTNNVSTSKHGFAPKAPNDATKFFDGTANYDTVKDSDLSLSDITTNDVSTTKHGFAPKAPNNTTRFLRGDATWSALPSPHTTVSTYIPKPAGLEGVATNALNSNTTMLVGQIYIPFKIIANKISFRNEGAATSGTADITMYSEDGQNQIFTVTTGTINAESIITTSLSSETTINPGVYYIAINPNSTTDVQPWLWTAGSGPFIWTGSILSDVASEPVLAGTLTITAGTPPSTITPNSITESSGPATLIFRLDN